jgi:hypothetical protein
MRFCAEVTCHRVPPLHARQWVRLIPPRAGLGFTRGPVLSYFYRGYDNAGNLFVVGENYSTKGFVSPGAVQWDAKYMTIADPGQGKLFRITVSESEANVVGTTALDGYVTNGRAIAA